jgi:hypothetical protein
MVRGISETVGMVRGISETVGMVRGISETVGMVRVISETAASPSSSNTRRIIETSNAELDASKRNVMPAENEETFQRDHPSQDVSKKAFAAQDDDGSLEASAGLPPPPPPTRRLPPDPTRRRPLPPDPDPDPDPDPAQRKAEPGVEVPVSEGAAANEDDAAPSSESNGHHDEDWYQRTFASELNELPVGNEFETSSIVSGFSRSGAEDLSGFTRFSD